MASILSTARRWRPEHADSGSEKWFPLDRCVGNNAITNYVFVCECVRVRLCAFALPSMCCGFLICYELQLCLFIVLLFRAYAPGRCRWRCDNGTNTFNCTIPFQCSFSFAFENINGYLLAISKRVSFSIRTMSHGFHNGFLPPPKIVRTWHASHWQSAKVAGMARAMRRRLHSERYNAYTEHESDWPLGMSRTV